MGSGFHGSSPRSTYERADRELGVEHKSKLHIRGKMLHTWTQIGKVVIFYNASYILSHIYWP